MKWPSPAVLVTIGPIGIVISGATGSGTVSNLARDTQPPSVRRYVPEMC